MLIIRIPDRLLPLLLEKTALGIFPTPDEIELEQHLTKPLESNWNIPDEI